MTFYSRPFPLLSELPSAIHNSADSYLINHCSCLIFALSWQLGSMLGFVFAKSRSTHPTAISIEHMKRINEYNAHHYIWAVTCQEELTLGRPLQLVLMLEGDIARIIPVYYYYFQQCQTALCGECEHITFIFDSVCGGGGSLLQGSLRQTTGEVTVQTHIGLFIKVDWSRSLG